MRSLRIHKRKRLQGCLPNPPDTEHALTHPSLSACVPACVGARAARVSHRKPIRPQHASPKYCANRPGPSPASPPTSSASSQTAPSPAFLHQHLGVPASHTSPASPASLKPFKNCPLRVGFGGRRTWRASLRSSQRSFLRKCGRRRCAENVEHTVFIFIFPRVSVGLEGRTTWHQKPVARPGRPGMFWGPSVWAGLRAGDAGNAEELGAQQNTAAVYPTGCLSL